MFSTLNRRALLTATVVTLLLIASIYVGSRNLGNFDPALIAYLFACIFACFGTVYRYTVWLQRPPTWRYFARGWQLFFSGKAFVYGWELVRHFVTNFLGQRFIARRGKDLGRGHMLMAWGCVAAFGVTFPLVYGWIHFDLAEGSIDTYVIHVFGFPTIPFAIHGFLGFLIFNALNWSAILVIAGVMLLMRRRLIHAGQIATQIFERDWMPLLLLLAISLTGLGISLDYKFMDGKAHQFMAITHAITVILFLIWLPFGKFFHIIQRPAQLGIAIYRKAGAEGPQAECPHSREAFTSQMQVDDLKAVTRELGYDFQRADGGSHLDYSPRGKRALLAKAHLKARQESGKYFG
jgi:nitrate reductase gamma subunit